jgi:hypothetical protein
MDDIANAVIANGAVYAAILAFAGLSAWVTKLMRED